MTLLLAILAALNVFTFLLYGWDKWSAQTQTRRTPEKTLWLFTLLGGSIGALAGMRFFRHKTQKASFQLVIALILLLHIVAVIGIVRTFHLSIEGMLP